MSTGRGARWGAALAAVAVLAVAAPSRADDPAPAPAPAPTAPVAKPAGYLPTASWQLLADVNKHRRARGLRALTVDPRLAAAARAWAERMAAQDTLSHNDPLFSAASHRRLAMRSLGENVGFDISVGAQGKAFLASRHHRANVELPGFRVAGFAVVRDRAGHLWSVEDFGTPRA
jgi:uncharacterized protein YkwD